MKKQNMGAMEQFEKRGATVYRLASFVKWAAFRFLAVTTGIFIWVSFAGYFSEKVGPVLAPVLSAFAVVIMFALIDKGLDALMEFLADEKLSPSLSDSEAKAKNRQRFMRIALLLAVLRLAATGTTSVWGSFEIAEFVTQKPDETAIVQQMSSENASLDAARQSLSAQLADAKRQEVQRIKQAKSQGRAMVDAAVAKHPRQEVRDGVRYMRGWYSTTPKLRKYRDGVQAAMADSANLVQSEMRRVQDLQAQLVGLETEGLKAANQIKSQLAAVAVSNADQYEQTKARRSNFLIIADLIAVVFGLLAIWVRATFRAAVGQESVLEERTLEGILWAAVRRASNRFLAWLEKLLGVDLDGDGKVGSVSSPVPETVPEPGTTGTSDPKLTPHPGLVPVSNTRTTVVGQQSKRVLVETSNLKRLARQQWERAFTSKDEETRKKNRSKALENQRELEALGYEVTRRVEDDPNSPTGKIGKMEIRIPDNA